MTYGIQDYIVFAIVAGVTAAILYKWFGRALMNVVARFLLKRGKVAWAMRLRVTD